MIGTCLRIAAVGVVLIRMLVVAVPAEAGNPTPTASVKGTEVYQMYCASCHGAKGDGNGPVAPGLNPRPTNFTDAAIMNRLTDDVLIDFVSKGGGAAHNCPTMPSWAPILQKDDITGVVSIIRAFSPR